MPGLYKACQGPHAATNYDPEMASRTWPMLSGMRRGDAVFAVSYRNTPCPAVGLKPLFLAADHWRRTGRLGDIRITVILEADVPFGLPVADREILHALRTLGATVHTRTRIDAVDPRRRTVNGTAHDGAVVTVHYDALHVAPPYRAHDWLVDAGLTHPDTSMVAVDARTLEHPRHPGLWSLGDAAVLDTPPREGAFASRCRSSATTSGPAASAPRTGTTTATQSPRYRSPAGDCCWPTRPRRAGAAHDRCGVPVQPASGHLVVRPAATTADLLAQASQGQGLSEIRGTPTLARLFLGAAI